ncbi:hypothetical protein SAY87_021736 [Trapa incisa]|uniref:Phytocyanin domain-containing protein n=1 Tax=Trapa incisa TaxID=236973 RepID=A0AAN7JSE9_9MYRT|nr:hypothetical protein SAY87_021736 [Trapa incisa]
MLLQNKRLWAFIFAAWWLCLSGSATAYKFYVGGRDGWALHPSEDYGHWAGRNRFLINDILYFKYKKGEDSVLLVNKNDYDSCNNNSPIRRWDDGDTVFTFDRSGPFFFISGEDDHCRNGQKLIVVVLAVRNHTPSVPVTPPPKASAPGTSTPGTSLPPAGAPGATSPAPLIALSPKAPSMSPTASLSPGAAGPIAGSPATVPAASPTAVPSLSPSLTPGPSETLPPSPSPLSSIVPSGSVSADSPLPGSSSNGTGSPTNAALGSSGSIVGIVLAVVFLVLSS